MRNRMSVPGIGLVTAARFIAEVGVSSRINTLDRCKGWRG
ncbi:transposase [Alicyclobacillus fastidiosus]